jgi:hypothetical protein
VPTGTKAVGAAEDVVVGTVVELRVQAALAGGAQQAKRPRFSIVSPARVPPAAPPPAAAGPGADAAGDAGADGEAGTGSA